MLLYRQLRAAGDLYAPHHAAPLAVIAVSSSVPVDVVLDHYRHWRTKAFQTGEEPVSLTAASIGTVLRGGPLDLGTAVFATRVLLGP